MSDTSSKLVEKRKRTSQKEKYSLIDNMAFMLKLAWNRRRRVIIFSFLIAGGAVLFGLVQLFVVPTLLDAVETRAAVSELVIMICLFTASLMILGAARAYLDSCSQFGRIELRLVIGELIQNKSLTMPYPDVENQDIRKKMDKAFMLVASNQAATETIWTTVTNLLINLSNFAIYTSVLVTLSPFMIFVVAVISVINYSISNYLNGWGYRHRDEESEYSRKMNYLSEKSRDYTLGKDVRIFGMRSWMEDVYSSVLRLYKSFAAKAEKIYFIGNVADIFLGILRNGIVYYFLIKGILTGEMSAAQFVLYFNTVNIFTSGIGGIMNDFANLRKQSLDISAVREFLDCPESFQMEEGIALFPDLKIPYQIELRNVSFAYPKAEKNTLSHINLTIKQGEKLAVVGLNGAGKTTLIKLICGFFDPTEGQVFLNGVDIRKYNRRNYYEMFSAVFQDFSVLDVTIAENVAQTNENLDQEKVKRCIAMAGLAKKIADLPNDLETHVGRVFEDGINLSGGELQRLMLARALYKNAPIIILDEPTSALDPIAESEIYNKYNELTDGRMAVYISHRLASTKFCDRIILMENGNIEEAGTHDELMKKNGRYAELFEIQSKYYREGGIEVEKEC